MSAQSHSDADGFNRHIDAFDNAQADAVALREIGNLASERVLRLAQCLAAESSLNGVMRAALEGSMRLVGASSGVMRLSPSVGSGEVSTASIIKDNVSSLLISSAEDLLQESHARENGIASVHLPHRSDADANEMRAGESCGSVMNRHGRIHVRVRSRCGELLAVLVLARDQTSEPPEHGEILRALPFIAQAIESTVLHQSPGRTHAPPHAVQWDLRRTEQQLALLMQVGKMGMWDWTIGTNRVEWSPGLEEIHGREPGSFLGTMDDAISDVHPKDRARVEAAIHPEDWPELSAALRAAGDSAGDGKFVTEYRVRGLDDGRQRWICATGQMQFRDGEPVRCIGSTRDVTRQRQAEALVRASEARFRMIADASPTLIWLAGADKHRTWFN